MPGVRPAAGVGAGRRALLNEFVFRFNRRCSRSRGLVFYRVLELAVAHEPLRYRQIVADPTRGKARQPPGTRGHPPTLQRRRAVRPWRRALAP